jgi:activator of HSP90 ATPase
MARKQKEEAMTGSIHQEVLFDASAVRTYQALTDAARFAAFTGAPAEISGEPGGAFSCFGGMISGRNIELIPGQRVVQAWRAGNWPPGTYSIVRFELKPQGEATRLVFDQAGHPAEQQAHLEDGWQKMCWEPLRKYLS